MRQRIQIIGLIFGLALNLVGAAAWGQVVEPGTEQPPASTGCPPRGLRDVRVSAQQPPQLVKSISEKGRPLMELRDTVAVHVKGLKTLLAQEACLEQDGADHRIILYLDGRPVVDAVAEPPTDPESEILMFPLRRSEASRDLWTHLLGRPSWKDRPVQVSVGLDNQFAVASDFTVDLRVIPRIWFLFWLALFLLFGVGFLVLAYKSNVLRDPVPTMGGSRQPYSLARTQAAWWFFLILGSYLLIGMITGDFSSTITSTVLVLLGISAGTAVGSAFVDASQTSMQDQMAEAALAQSLQARIKELDKDIAEQQTMMQSAPDDVVATVNLAAMTGLRAEKYSKYCKLTGQSERFLLDILSDSGGVNFHRFQMAAWTVVLGFIFIGHVYRDLAMPEFNTTLLGLMGISAGTYLGLKIPEKPKPETNPPVDSVPPIPPTPPVPPTPPAE